MFSTDKGALAYDFSFNAGGEDLFNKKAAFIQDIALSTIKRSATALENIVPANPDYKWSKDLTKFFPFAQSETILSQYEANTWDAWGCFNIYTPCHPGAPMCLTCGVAPFKSIGIATLTNKSMLLLKGRSNYPWMLCKMCWYSSDTTMFWTPISEFTGTSVDTQVQGNENWMSRCFRGTVCGKYCCPMLKSVVGIECVVSGEQNPISLLVSDMQAFRNEDKIKFFRKDTAKIQKELYNKLGTVVGQPIQAAAEMV